MPRARFLRPAIAAVFGLSLAPFVATGGPQVLADQNGIRVEDGYVFAAGASATTGAAFMRITNESGTDDWLLEVRTDAAARAQLHASDMTDGVARMRSLGDGVALPAGQTLVLERGGMHVMLMGLSKPLADGASVPMTLVFEHAGSIDVTLPVDLAQPAAAVGGMKKPSGN